MVRTGILLSSLLAVSTALADESYEDRWVRIANEHLALVKVEPGKSYEYDLIKVHNTFWKDVTDKCSGSAKRGKVEAFSAVAVIGDDGVIAEFLTVPRSPHLACFEQEMVGKRYPKPPSYPFYELLEVKL
ncbi:hypothetical protein [Tahibacter amnicola]|uniref:TonB-like protein n=1 Tax=Tahibacter amnicola TaxID=2976241 RepID=A0ABY6BHI3_9GAMM|nr:hypothetical protein [Tahibacter amnicola]UXI68540.1 hypothetical protein N4264_02475 [Tahibacter amnicola]